jgi:hypothetical protein
LFFSSFAIGALKVDESTLIFNEKRFSLMQGLAAEDRIL